MRRGEQPLNSRSARRLSGIALAEAQKALAAHHTGATARAAHAAPRHRLAVRRSARQRRRPSSAQRPADAPARGPAAAAASCRTGSVRLRAAPRVTMALAGERLDIFAPQAVEVPAAAQGARDILAEHAHVGALGAQHAQLEPIAPAARAAPARRSRIGARRALDRQPAPRQPYSGSPVALERRIHRRHLLLRTEEALEHGLDRRARQRRHRRSARRPAPSASPVVGALAELRARSVAPCGRRAAHRPAWWPRRGRSAACRWPADRGCRYARP